MSMGSRRRASSTLSFEFRASAVFVLSAVAALLAAYDLYVLATGAV